MRHTEKDCTEIVEKITDKITLINGDCMEYMATLPDKYFDLCIADPPYGININESIGRRKGEKHSGRKKAIWDKKSIDKHLFDMLILKSKNQIIWGANHFISKIPYDSSCWIMWDKKFSEFVSFAQFELAWTSFNTTCKKYEQSPATSEYKFHPTQKPAKLYEWILKKYAKAGQRIFDPMFGNASSAIACHNLGFEYVGCELDNDYFQIALKRVENHILQQKIEF